jgi:GDP-4-dehydro-6-deoxy-D-mannose reductase
MRRVLVTGAQGFCGRWTVARLLRADPGVEVLGLGRSREMPDRFSHRVHWGDVPIEAPLPSPLRSAIADARYRYVAVDLLDVDRVNAVLRAFRPAVVVHLAAALRDDPPPDLFRSNVAATRTLYEAIARAGGRPPTVVLGSSGSIYGEPPATALPVDETRAPAPSDPYAESKAAAEQAAAILAHRHGIPTVVARIFNVVGPGQDERHVCGWLARQVAEIAAGMAEPRLTVGRLDTTRDFIDVRDVARALHLLAEHGLAGETYNVASGIEMRIGRVLCMILDLGKLAGSVGLEERPARSADPGRMVADVRRLGALGFACEYPLARSLQDLLHYYGSTVRSSGVAAC